MPRRKQEIHKPPIPPDTCPHIDRVIELARDMYKVQNTTLIERYTAIIEAEMEYIRESNDLLRRASKYWYEQWQKN